MKPWCEVLDHGDDPGRFTVIHGDGRVLTVNQNGSVILQRKCHNPAGVVADLCRQPDICILKPKYVPALLEKIELFLSTHSQ